MELMYKWDGTYAGNTKSKIEFNYIGPVEQMA